MCPFAHACPNAAFRPALVSQRDCYRQFPDQMRPRPGLSEHAIDTLASQRKSGEKLHPVTLAVLDQFRPSGPTSSFRMKRPVRPSHEGAVARNGRLTLPAIPARRGA